MNKKLIDWLKVQKPGPFELNGNQPTSNVFIADFIELKDFQFCRTVIELNNKIFQDLLKNEQHQSNGYIASAADDYVDGNDNEPQDLIRATSDNNWNDNNIVQL